MVRLAQLPICVQRLHYDAGIDSSYNQHLHNATLKAIFLQGTLWDRGSEITVSFLPLPDNDVDTPKWYPLSQVQEYYKANQDPFDPLEIEVRKMSPPEAFRKVIESKVVPIVKDALTIRFVDMDSTDVGMLRIRFAANGGSSSLVGTQSLQVPGFEHTITFGWLDVATMVHEFSHALGMVHEHQNPVGGIQWNEPAVYQWAKETQGWDEQTTYNNIIKRYSVDQVSGSVFDPKSIMLYFYPPELTLNNQGTRQNTHYSDTDIFWLKKNYGNPDDLPPPIQPPITGGTGSPAPKPPPSPPPAWLKTLLWIVLFLIIMLLGIFLYLSL